MDNIRQRRKLDGDCESSPLYLQLCCSAAARYGWCEGESYFHISRFVPSLVCALLQWFDGGIEGNARPTIAAMLKKMQPRAVAFNGCVVKGGGAQNKSTCITPNALRWIGTEAGVAPDPNWSTGYNKGGDPNSDMFAPGESDTTLQNGDQWFYDAKGGIRTLAELQDVYHGTVGRNSFLMMDFAPTPEGLIAPIQVGRYKEFGDWMRGCYYGTGVAGKIERSLGSVDAGTSQLVRFDTPQTIDRVVIREDQTEGQAIRGWEIRGETSSNQWSVLASGSSVGNKWITLLDNNVTVTALNSTVTASAPGTESVLLCNNVAARTFLMCSSVHVSFIQALLVKFALRLATCVLAGTKAPPAPSVKITKAMVSDSQRRCTEKRSQNAVPHAVRRKTALSSCSSRYAFRDLGRSLRYLSSATQE